MRAKGIGSLIKVRFDRESPDPATAQEVEVILDYVPSDDFTLPENPGVLVQRSVTRTDTREPVELTDDEKKAVWREAANYVAEKML
jgi:hypothetical protein